MHASLEMHYLNKKPFTLNFEKFKKILKVTKII